MRRPMRITSKLLALAAIAAGLATSAPAAAQKSKQNTPRGVITLAEVTITGRIQKPIAAVDVARIRPKLTLHELRAPFVKRIEQAIYKAPF